MAKLFIQDTTLTAIADAIREKNGETGGVATTIIDRNAENYSDYYYTVNCSEEERAAFGALKTGDIVTWVWTYNGTEYTSTGAVEVSKGGTYQVGAVILPNATTVLANIDLEPKSLVYYNGVVEVPYIASDGSIHASHLKITTAGAAAYTPLQMPAAILAIEGGGMTPSGELEILENGIYDVTTYASAQVSVPTGVFPEGTFPITQNGEYNIKSYEKVLVDVASGGGGLEPVVLSGNCDYACAGKLADSVIPQMPGKITTNNIYQAPYMFYNSGLEEIPFELNFYPNYDMSEVNHMFNMASNLKKFPTIKNLNPKNASQMFSGCNNLTDIPEGATSTWSFNKWQTSASAQVQHMFKGCARLRHIDSNLLKNLWNCNNTYLYNVYYYLFNDCSSLDEVRNLGVSTATLTGNAFNSTFNNCGHLKNFTFVSGKSANWKSQTIDLTSVGYLSSEYQTKSADFTNDLKVTDLASYEALNGNSAWWTASPTFSRYNHDSAVATINSLPTITSTGGTNTIKFRGTMGSGYGKAISDLTEAEIAVATAKGWTVSIT